MIYDGLQNEGLLFQFILAELISASDPTSVVRRVVEGEESAEFLCDHLVPSISFLSGSGQSYLRLFTTSWSGGALAKLKNTCAFLCQNAHNRSRLRLNVSHEANRAWLLSVQTLDLALAWQESTFRHTYNVEEEPWTMGREGPALGEILIRFIRCWEQLCKAIRQLIPYFRRDENVLFFILRHHQQLDAIYGQHFVSKLFLKLYPRRGNDAVGRFLAEKYEKRGFEHLLPIIEQNIQQLTVHE